MKTKVPACIIRRLISKVKFQKKSAHLYTWVNRFVCNILDIIHSSNSVLRSGGGGWWGWVGCIFLEDICDIVFGLFDTKIKQHMISTDRVSIPSLK